MRHKDKEWLSNKYWVENKTMREMAQEAGVSVKTISRWMHKLEVPTRTTYEAQLLRRTQSTRVEAIDDLRRFLKQQ